MEVLQVRKLKQRIFKEKCPVSEQLNTGAWKFHYKPRALNQCFVPPKEAWGEANPLGDKIETTLPSHIPPWMKTGKENVPKHDDKESGRRTYNVLYKTKNNSVEFEIKLKLNMCKN